MINLTQISKMFVKIVAQWICRWVRYLIKVHNPDYKGEVSQKIPT